MKVSELSGMQLDWAVAKALGGYKPVAVPAYSTDWAQGGPIIERERVGVRFDFEEDEWQATAGDFDDWVYGWGETPLIAAMRCYIASKLGDEVDLPEELNAQE
jgi:hypothetical protein